MTRHQEPKAVVVGGKALRCPACDHDRFEHRRALLAARGAAFIGLEWLSPRADLQICDRCGYVNWFRPRRA